MGYRVDFLWVCPDICWFVNWMLLLFTTKERWHLRVCNCCYLSAHEHMPLHPMLCEGDYCFLLWKQFLLEGLILMLLNPGLHWDTVKKWFIMFSFELSWFDFSADSNQLYYSFYCHFQTYPISERYYLLKSKIHFTITWPNWRRKRSLFIQLTKGWWCFQRCLCWELKAH